MFKYKIYIVLLLPLIAVSPLRAQQVRARIAGLENNREYLHLLSEDARLQAREDSIVRRVESVRQLFREDAANRKAYGAEILQLEERIFELRNTKGRLIDQINAIEQDWVLAHLDQVVQPAAPDEAVATAPARQFRNLVYNAPFAEHLPPADYSTLRRAQRREAEAVGFVDLFAANYAALRNVQEQYAAVSDEETASGIYEHYLALKENGRALGDSLAGIWSYVFDNKTYAYGYILDKLRQDELLGREVEHLAQMQRRLTTIEGEYESDALAAYFMQKQAVVRYETALADLFELGDARDSLVREAAYLEGVDYRLPVVELTRRYFLDYQPIGFASPARYNTHNPIPELKVYEHGTIYRIRLGAFRARQAVSIFKGVYPLAWAHDDEDRYVYYAGGFATLEEAESARRKLLDKGFRRPEIVVWQDGRSENLTQRLAEGLPVANYRVEIVGAETLSDPVREAIRQTAEGVEVSRAGSSHFVVGTFPDRDSAERVAEAVRRADDRSEIKVTETGE